MKVLILAIFGVFLYFAPLGANDPSGFAVTTPDIVRIQQSLADRGFDPGPIDGRMGRHTEATLAAFQAAYGLAVTGKPDEMTLKALFNPVEDSFSAEQFWRAAQSREPRIPDAMPRTLVERIPLDRFGGPAPTVQIPAGAPVEPGGLGDRTTATPDLIESKRGKWGIEDRTSLIQQLLIEEGFDPGPVDGKMGPRTRTAIKAYRTAHRLTDKSDLELFDQIAARGHFTRAYRYQESGHDEISIKEYSEGILLEPNLFAAYFNRGLIHHKRGDYDLAIADFDAALNLIPWYGKAYFIRGSAYYEKGFYLLAARDYFRAVFAAVTN